MWKTLENRVKITPGTSNGRIYELPSLEPTLWRFQTSLKSVAVCSPSWKRLRLNSLGEVKIWPWCREHVLDKKQNWVLFKVIFYFPIYSEYSFYFLGTPNQQIQEKKQMFVCHWLIHVHLHACFTSPQTWVSFQTWKNSFRALPHPRPLRLAIQSFHRLLRGPWGWKNMCTEADLQVSYNVLRWAMELVNWLVIGVITPKQSQWNKPFTN